MPTQAYRINLSSAWEVSSWRQLEPDVRAAVYRGAADPRAWQVQMRAPVVQLHAWWDRRLQVNAAESCG